ncbi:MAG TPA: ATP-binding cassette domain-containing protein [Xanthobacteraceae bacterium]|nr:ATP-binding cassette domain-containing protein [Xanthobacteraceae bacterium]
MSTAALRRTAQIVEFAPAPAAPPHGLAINVQGLRKSFGDNEVLKGIDLQIDAGQFVAIVGRSGCGKSTLLRLLLGLEQPSGGTFAFEDGATRIDNPRVARVMFQEPRLLPWASVVANVEVGLGPDRKQVGARDRALATLHAVELEDKRDAWPSVLSGGQKQRVSLARALVSRPRILALDEPLGALDALTRITMQRLLERMWLDQGFTALLVTHDVAEAVTIADRVIMIDDGRIALDINVDLPRPRARGSAEVAALEGRILDELFAGGGNLKAPG